MIKCWLCREPFEKTMPLVYGIQGCPSCLTPIFPETGEMHSDPAMMNVGIALARAMDRLARAMDGNTQSTLHFAQTVKDTEPT